MISSNIIARISGSEGVGWPIVEKDYFLTLLLEGISENLVLKDALVFKGGTALRKVYFEHYRYSEDLDFTLKKPLDEIEIKNALNNVFQYLKKEHNADFRVKDLYVKEWFIDIKVQFVGLRGGKNTIAIDILKDEIITDIVGARAVFNPYYKKEISLHVYSLEEILAEKLRSLLQRTRVRDYYDCWFIVARYKDKLNMKKVKQMLIEKIKHKKLPFPEKFLDKNKIEQAKAYYQSQIGSYVKDHPNFDQLIMELSDNLKIAGLQ